MPSGRAKAITAPTGCQCDSLPRFSGARAWPACYRGTGLARGSITPAVSRPALIGGLIFIGTVLLVLALGPADSRGAGPERVQVETPGPAALERLNGLGLDVAQVTTPESDVLLWSRADRRALRRAGLDFRLLADPPPTPSSAPELPSGRTTYRYWEDYQQKMRELARRHPGLVRLRDMGKTRLGRNILGLEIARDVWNRDGRPSFFQYGAHHSREWPSAEWPMEFAIELVENSDEGQLADLLDRVRFFIFPVINVDAFIASRGAGPSPTGSPLDFGPILGAGSNEYRRKTCRPLAGERLRPCSAQNPRGGVDLNRNYGYYWGGVGTDQVPTSEINRGPRAFSEPESEAVRRFTARFQPLTLLTHHTYSDQGIWLRPPAFQDPELFPGGLAPDEPELAALADAMGADTGWPSIKGYDFYPVTGATDDWNYLAQASLAFTSEGKGPNFHSYFDLMVRDVYPGMSRAMVTAAEAASTAGSVITGQAPPGARLEVAKQFEMPTCDGFTEEIHCILPGPSLPEELSSTMVVDQTGQFSWRVNPSSRPLVSGESWTLTCSPPGGQSVSRQVEVARGGTAEVDLSDCDPGELEAPSAGFRPIEEPLAGERVNLLATGYGKGLPITSYSWDMDGDGQFGDATGRVASRVWNRPGRRSAGLRVTDSAGQVSTARKTVSVARQPAGRPSLSLRLFPASTVVDRNVAFVATGSAGRYFWDLDGDGRFSDGRGAEVSRTYLRPGSYRIGVRLVGENGRKSVERRTLRISG